MPPKRATRTPESEEEVLEAAAKRKVVLEECNMAFQKNREIIKDLEKQVRNLKNNVTENEARKEQTEEDNSTEQSISIPLENESPQDASQIKIAREGALELAYQENDATKNVLRTASVTSLATYNLLNNDTLTAEFKGHGYNKADALSWSLTSTVDCEIIFSAGQIFVPSNRGRTQNHILRDELKGKNEW